MLRKTKHNRNSMKRNGESKLSLSQSDFHNNNSGKFNKLTIERLLNSNIIYIEPYVETSPGYSTVVFHSKSPDSILSIFEGKKIPEVRKTSPEMEMFSSSVKQLRSDTNENFIKEEIAPGIKHENRLQTSLSNVSSIFRRNR